METSRRSNRQIATTLEYYSALRLLMGAYAYCGTHVVQASGEALLREAPRHVQYFTLQRTLQYADEVMQFTIKISIPEAEKLAWMRRRDEQIRTEMAALMNDGRPGDEALQEAGSKYAHLWVMRDWSSAVPVGDQQQQRGQVRP